MIIHTSSGSKYSIQHNRITRMTEKPMLSRSGEQIPDLVINRPILDISEPTIGRGLRVHYDKDGTPQYIHTSAVTSIEGEL